MEQYKEKEWKSEIKKYDKKIDMIINWSPNFSEKIKQLPEIPLTYTPSVKGHIALNIALFTTSGCFFIAQKATKAFYILWKTTSFSMISLPVRLIYEIFGASYFAHKLLTKMQEGGNIEKIKEKTQKLTLGTRSDVEFPWPNTPKIKSFNIMDFIRSLEEIDCEAESKYAFLCESCHPSFWRLTTWNLAGPPLANWDNPTFKKKGHKLINRTVDILIDSQKELNKITKRTLRIAMPYIQQDQKL